MSNCSNIHCTGKMAPCFERRSGWVPTLFPPSLLWWFAVSNAIVRRQGTEPKEKRASICGLEHTKFEWARLSFSQRARDVLTNRN
jgi:hypothetical protein